ncbi:MAG: nuclear transport factor 2 family protein [Bryobacteraceae bacterium]|nr:nuclear transport factor 2 family protein [Bryobacteraceae bacterium]MDW8378728.1 nuclear transport factor 2 family protein [Bryobacterales bacterium]
MFAARTCLILSVLAFPAAGISSAEIEALDRAWRDAVVQRDFARLDQLLAPDLIYAHASGVVDTKQSYLEKLRSGKQIYRTLEQHKVSVRIHGEAAITHSWVHVTGTNPAGPFDDKVMMLHVWVKKGTSWLLAAHQTTRVEALPHEPAS